MFNFVSSEFSRTFLVYCKCKRANQYKCRVMVISVENISKKGNVAS